jgi:hypothetical protein
MKDAFWPRWWIIIVYPGSGFAVHDRAEIAHRADNLEVLAVVLQPSGHARPRLALGRAAHLRGRAKPAVKGCQNGAHGVMSSSRSIFYFPLFLDDAVPLQRACCWWWRRWRGSRRQGNPPPQKDIAAATELKESVVKVQLGRMVAGSEVVKTKRGEYAHPWEVMPARPRYLHYLLLRGKRVLFFIGLFFQVTR